MTSQWFAETNLDGSPAARIQDFFAIDDPWLDGYFRMLASEFEGRDAAQPRPDPLLLDETVHLVSRHLVRWHSDAGAGARHELDLQTKVSPRRPGLVRRVEEYVDENLERDIGLSELRPAVLHVGRSLPAVVPCRARHHALPPRPRAAVTPGVDDVADDLGTGRGDCGEVRISEPLALLCTRFHAAFGVSPSHFRRDS